MNILNIISEIILIKDKKKKKKKKKKKINFIFNIYIHN